MTFSSSARRTAVLGVALSVAACDVAVFATDARPILEETWSVPAGNTSISVTSLLPSDVSIYSTPASTPPDSSAFLVSLPDFGFVRRVADNCALCNALNGMTTFKPGFAITADSLIALPANVVAAALVGATVTYTVTNGLSFDPLFVNTVTSDPQGYATVVIRSGSLELGRDSIDGSTTPLPTGAMISRSIPIAAGVITAPISIHLTIYSPAGDHPEFIDAGGTVSASASIANLRVARATLDVPNVAIGSTSDTLDLTAVDAFIARNATGATLELTIDNPWPVEGSLIVNLETPSQTIAKPLVLPPATTPATTQKRTVTLTTAELQQLFGNRVALSLSGSVTSSSPVVVTPTQSVSMRKRLILVIRTGS